MVRDSLRTTRTAQWSANLEGRRCAGHGGSKASEFLRSTFYGLVVAEVEQNGGDVGAALSACVPTADKVRSRSAPARASSTAFVSSRTRRCACTRAPLTPPLRPQLYGNKARTERDWSALFMGSCAIAVVVDKQRMVVTCANCGDSRAVIGAQEDGSDGILSSRALSHDHR